jgi:hypothetical protein
VGQEILYCNKCGKRLVGEDFTRGRAHTFNHRQYCTQCLPQQHASAPPPPPAQEDSRGRARLKPPTARTTPVPAPSKPGAMIRIGVGLGIAATGVIAVLLLTRPEPPPPPDPVVTKPVPPPVPAGPSKEQLARELKELEPKVQKFLDGEQFSAAVDLLGEARKRHKAADWVKPIDNRIQEVQAIPTGLYSSLKNRATSARLRGALTEVQQERARVVNWGRKDLLEDLDRALAVIVPREPLPPGAKVLVQYPGGDPSRYRTTGQIKDGMLLAGSDNNGVFVGFESGKEIFKVPEEGEIRMVFTTTSPKLMTVVLRALGPDGKNHPYNHWLENPDVGKPQAIKIPVGSLKSWNKEPILKSAVVDNIYVRQDDTAAVLKIHEFVIFATKP